MNGVADGKTHLSLSISLSLYISIYLKKQTSAFLSKAGVGGRTAFVFGDES